MVKDKNGLFACFVDFRKAFDITDRELLVYKLGKIGIHGRFLEITKQMYKNTANTIRINKEFSWDFSSSNGVVQGNNISPTYFALFINDLLEKLKTIDAGIEITTSTGNAMINVLAYADDIALISREKEGLQKLLDFTMAWCKNWRMLINTDKTKVMHFHWRSVKRSDHVFTMGRDLETVGEYKYLGYVLNETLNCEDSVNHLVGAASRALGEVLSHSRNNFDLGYETYTKLFFSCVAPILDYSAGVWGCGQHLPKIDGIQNRAIRFFCGLPKMTPIAGLTGDMGWVPSTIRRDLDMLQLFNQVTQMEPDRLT